MGRGRGAARASVAGVCPATPTLPARPRLCLQSLRVMNRLAKAMRARRAERGALQLASPEAGVGGGAGVAGGWARVAGRRPGGGAWCARRAETLALVLASHPPPPPPPQCPPTHPRQTMNQKVKFDIDTETHDPLDVGMYTVREANQVIGLGRNGGLGRGWLAAGQCCALGLTGHPPPPHPAPSHHPHSSVARWWKK